MKLILLNVNDYTLSLFMLTALQYLRRGKNCHVTVEKDARLSSLLIH